MRKFRGFRFGKRYTVEIPHEGIADVGVGIIRQLLNSVTLDMPVWRVLNPTLDLTTIAKWLPALPYDWQWVWNAPDNGDYSGTLTKRIAKFYYKAHGIKLPDTFISEIGNVARKHDSVPTVSYIDFARYIKWQAGDYGDYGSCWWGSCSKAKWVLTHNGGFAIRSYESADSVKGKGRAWVAPIMPDSADSSDNAYVVFNGYGMGSSDSTLRFAEIFARLIGAEYKPVDLRNNGSSHGYFYINGGRGYMVGTANVLANYQHAYDFSFDNDHDAPNHCNDCGEKLFDDDTYYSPDGEPYCEACFYERYTYCDKCGETMHRDDGVYLESRSETYCEYCTDRYCTRCEDCGQYFISNEIAGYDDDENPLCENCYEEPTDPTPDNDDESSEQS